MADERKEQGQAAVRSFRVTDEVMTRFNEIKDELKLNQDGALGLLIRGYEMSKAKEVIPDRGVEIANFECKVQEIVDAFLHSLQLNCDAEARIRSEVALELSNKDRVIAGYLEQVDTLKRQLGEMAEKQRLLLAAEMEVASLKSTISGKDEEMQLLQRQSQKTIADKEMIISTLQRDLTAAEAKADGYGVLEARAKTLEIELAEAKTQIQAKESKHQLEVEKAAVKAEQDKTTAVQEALKEARAEAREDRKADQQSLMDAMEAQAKLREELAVLRHEKEDLKAQIEKWTLVNDTLRKRVEQLEGAEKH